MERLHAGWLTKSPPEYKTHGPWKLFKSKWRRRYFVLYVPPSSNTLPGKMCPALLDYYSDDKMVNKKGSIDLEKCHTIFVNCCSEAYKFIFVMKTVDKERERDYYLSSESQDQLDEWVRILCNVVGLNEKTIQKPMSPIKSPDHHSAANTGRKASSQSSLHSANTMPSIIPNNSYTQSPFRPKLQEDYLYLEECSSVVKQPTDNIPPILPRKELRDANPNSPLSNNTQKTANNSIYNTPALNHQIKIISLNNSETLNKVETNNQLNSELKQRTTLHTDSIYNTPKSHDNDVYKMPKYFPNDFDTDDNNIIINNNDDNDDDNQFESIWEARESNAYSTTSAYMNNDLSQMHTSPSPSSQTQQQNANSVYDIPPSKPTLPPKLNNHASVHHRHHHHHPPNDKYNYINSGSLSQLGPSFKKNITTAVCLTETTIAFNKNNGNINSKFCGISSRSNDLPLPIKVTNHLHSDDHFSSLQRSSSSSEEEDDEDGDDDDDDVHDRNDIYDTPKYSKGFERSRTRISSDCNVFVNEVDVFPANNPPIKEQYLDLEFNDDMNIESPPPKPLIDHRIEYKEIDFEKTKALEEVRVHRANLHSQ